MQVSFGYTHYLKTYYLQGKLPTVKRGLYGGILTPETVSLEHILPKEKGGHTTLSNLALAIIVMFTTLSDSSPLSCPLWGTYREYASPFLLQELHA